MSEPLPTEDAPPNPVPRKRKKRQPRENINACRMQVHAIMSSRSSEVTAGWIADRMLDRVAKTGATFTVYAIDVCLRQMMKEGLVERRRDQGNGGFVYWRLIPRDPSAS